MRAVKYGVGFTLLLEASMKAPRGTYTRATVLFSCALSGSVWGMVTV